MKKCGLIKDNLSNIHFVPIISLCKSCLELERQRNVYLAVYWFTGLGSVNWATCCVPALVKTRKFRHLSVSFTRKHAGNSDVKILNSQFYSRWCRKLNYGGVQALIF